MSRKLRLGFVSIQDAEDVTQWSGIPAHVLASLRAQNINVLVFSPLSQKIKYALAPVKLLARFRNSSVSLDHFPLVLNSYARQIAKAIRDNPVDLIFATSSIPIAALKCSQPIIFWTDAVFHGMYNYYAGSFKGMRSSSVSRARQQEEMALNRCRVAVYASKWSADHAREITDPAKVHVLPFGASFSVEHNAADVQRWAATRRFERPNACDLLFVGVDWERKGGPVAVETARVLNSCGVNTSLTVVGCQPTDAVPDFVDVVGFISKSTSEGRDHLARLFKKSDFLILPSVAEAAGIVFCEASAFGIPSLSYDTGGVSDYVVNGVNGVCLPPQSKAVDFAQAILTTLRSPGKYEALCLGAYREFTTRLNWDTSVRSLIKLCLGAWGKERSQSELDQISPVFK